MSLTCNDGGSGVWQVTHDPLETKEEVLSESSCHWLLFRRGKTVGCDSPLGWSTHGTPPTHLLDQLKCIEKEEEAEGG